MSACGACGAPDGYCAWSCVVIEQSHARAVQSHTDGLLARWMTVEASEMYAALSFRAELDA